MIFAVFAGDLRRKFTVSDHRGTQPLFGRVSSWAPESYPSTLEEARKIMTPQPGQILSPEDFELSLQGRWPKGISRRFRPFLLTLAWRSLRGSKTASVEEIASDQEPARQRLITEIARILANRRIPSLVVHIPDRSTLLNPQGSPGWPKEDAIEFARAIGATFVDGERLFSGLQPREIRARFLPYDGHWNESGSNRFANFILQETPWLEEARPSHQEGRK